VFTLTLETLALSNLINKLGWSMLVPLNCRFVLGTFLLTLNKTQTLFWLINCHHNPFFSWLATVCCGHEPI